MKDNYENVGPVIKQIRGIHFRTDRDELLEKHLTRLFEVGEDGNLSHEPVRFTAGTETNGVIMIDGSGGGKSTAIEKVLKGFGPLLNNSDTGEDRYLKITVESPATQKSLGHAILMATGLDQISDRTKVWEIWNMVRHRLSVMGISLLWIDEAHDMFKADTTGAETDNMFKMLKSLMQGRHPVVLLLSGTERLSKITGLDPQLSRRFSKIRPRDLEMGADNDDLEELVRYLCSEAGIEFRVTGDLINRLIYGSRHRFGRAVFTTIRAIECALMNGADRLSIEHFEEAWGGSEVLSARHNVFAAEDWQSIELDVEEDEYETLRTAKPSKSRKRRK